MDLSLFPYNINPTPMKTVLRILSLVILGLFIFSFGTKPNLKETEVSHEDVTLKIKVLNDSLDHIKGRIIIPADSLLVEELDEMKGVLSSLEADITNAGEAEFFVIRMKCNQIEVWIDAYHDSLQAIHDQKELSILH